MPASSAHERGDQTCGISMMINQQIAAESGRQKTRITLATKKRVTTINPHKTVPTPTASCLSIKSDCKISIKQWNECEIILKMTLMLHLHDHVNIQSTNPARLYFFFWWMKSLSAHSGHCMGYGMQDRGDRGPRRNGGRPGETVGGSLPGHKVTATHPSISGCCNSGQGGGRCPLTRWRGVHQARIT